MGCTLLMIPLYPFMKVPLDCRPCFGVVFLSHGNESVMMYFSCLLWSCSPFGVAELISSLIIFKTAPDFRFGHA